MNSSWEGEAPATQPVLRWQPPLELDPATTAPVPVPEPADGSTTAAQAGAQAGATGRITIPEGGIGSGNALLPAEETAVSCAGAGPAPHDRHWGRWLAGALGTLLVVSVGLDAADVLARAFAISWALGTAVSGVLGVAGLATLGLLAGELRSLARLRTVAALQAEAETLRHSGSFGSAPDFVARLATLYRLREDLAPDLDTLHQTLGDAHDDREMVHLVERTLLAPIDQRAYRTVLLAARDTTIASALSPAAVLDIAMVLWRNLKLIRDVATLYGARPGYAGALRLTRRVLTHVAASGLTDSLHHTVVDTLGGTVAAMVSARLGQGMINGLLTARVGLAAMHLCRPIAFTAENQPSLAAISQALRGSGSSGNSEISGNREPRQPS